MHARQEVHVRAADPSTGTGSLRTTHPWTIDKGWLVQRALSEDRITHVRTTLRPPKDIAVTDLSIRLDRCRAKVELVSLELAPETEYESGTTLMDDYHAIVEEFRDANQP